MHPEYLLRYSKKAKYLQLRISKKGIEVVVPFKQSISKSHIHEFIIKKNDWILKTQKKYQLMLPSFSNHFTLPTQIQLLAINESWEVSYLESKQKLSLYTNPAKQIKLIGDISNKTNCLQALKKWLKQMAEIHLYQLLKKVSDEASLSFNQLSIRNNMTRWGSCTIQKNISLCCRLMFLPFHLVKHVLLHELCHTKCMNHGKSFWQLLEKLDPNTRKHRAELKNASIWIPEWMC